MPGTDDSCQTFLGSEFSRGNALFSKLWVFFFSFKTELPASIGKIALLGECGQNNNNKCDHINTTSLKNSMMLSGQ